MGVQCRAWCGPDGDAGPVDEPDSESFMDPDYQTLKELQEAMVAKESPYVPVEQLEAMALMRK